MYRLQLERRVTKALDDLPVTTRQRILGALAGLRSAPRPAGCVKIQGETSSYRMGVGKYRVIYAVDDAQHEITVWLIGQRRDAYRRL